MLTHLSYILTLQCSENKELQERITLLEQQLAAAQSQTTLSSSEQHGSEEYIDELKKKIQIQVDVFFGQQSFCNFSFGF